MLVRIANSTYPDQTALEGSSLIWVCTVCLGFWQATSVHNSRTFTVGTKLKTLFTDIDECSSSSSLCSNGFCENYMGGYQCTCFDGFRQNTQRTTCLGRCVYYHRAC